jgi:hypothetical protein
MLIDPRGLMDWGPFYECLMAKFDGDNRRNCNDVLFASSVASEFQGVNRICENIDKGLTCTARCTGETLFGSFRKFRNFVHLESALHILKHIAHESADLFLKRGVPVLEAVHIVHEVYEVAHCTVTCVKE